MIIYQATKAQFLLHVNRDGIEQVISRQYRAATGRGVGSSEVQSWKNSLFEMSNVLADEEIPADVGVACAQGVPERPRGRWRVQAARRPSPLRPGGGGRFPGLRWTVSPWLRAVACASI
jgi:hypothetical protein